MSGAVTIAPNPSPMCFSASASIVAGTTLSVIGRETVKKAKIKSDYPFASIPLIFAVQQFVEAAVWLTVGMPFLNDLLAFLFLVFAYAVWPVFVPVAILMMERGPVRRFIIKVFAVCGMVAGMTLLWSILSGPVEAQIIQHSIGYSSIGAFPAFIFWLYLAATTGSCMASSHRMVQLFGAVLFASCFTAYQCYANTFISVWCFFAAVLSFMVYFHFRPFNELVGEIKDRLKIA